MRDGFIAKSFAQFQSHGQSCAAPRQQHRLCGGGLQYVALTPLLEKPVSCHKFFGKLNVRLGISSRGGGASRSFPGRFAHRLRDLTRHRQRQLGPLLVPNTSKRLGLRAVAFWHPSWLVIFGDFLTVLCPDDHANNSFRTSPWRPQGCLRRRCITRCFPGTDKPEMFSDSRFLPSSLTLDRPKVCSPCPAL